MDIRVSGHQVDTGEALRSHVADRLSATVDKYQSRATSAHVIFGKGPHDHGFTCEILLYVPGEVMKSTDKAADAHAAFDAAAEKVEKQLRRHSRRLKDHHAGEVPDALDDAMRRDEPAAG
ncbi:MAG TPA: ribosome-associated translation inhibitor RaiA [Allosphingosinicella sp.]|jgi:ribosomal subunit interface protein